MNDSPEVNLAQPVTTGLDIVGTDFARTETASSEHAESPDLPMTPEQFATEFARATGITVEEFKSKHARFEQFQQVQSQAEIANQFLTSHAHDYAPTPENGKLMQSYI